MQAEEGNGLKILMSIYAFFKIIIKLDPTPHFHPTF